MNLTRRNLKTYDDAQVIAATGQDDKKSKPAKKGQAKDAIKLCLRCMTTPLLTEFYKNRGWAAQAYHDAWCKSCAKKFSVTKETIREYCWYNNRAWSEDLWQRVIDGARYKLAADSVYIKATDLRRRNMEESEACQIYLARMNMSNVYVYSENITPESGLYDVFDIDSKDGILHKSVQEAMRSETEFVFDPVWNGLFTRRDLEYLNNYYAELENDFVLDDVSMRDYGRKVAKASLALDQMYNDYRSNKVSGSEYKAAKDNFDTLSKSANFAACKRRTDEKINILPLGEVVEYLEAHKKIKSKKDNWKQDSVDAMIMEMYHIAESLGLDRGGMS